MTEFAQGGGQDQTRNVDINFNSNVSGYSAGVSQMSHQTNQLIGLVDTLATKVDGIGKRAGNFLGGLGKADFAGLAGATADAAGFEKQLGTLNATSAITGTSMRGLRNDVESTFNKFPIARGQVVGLVNDITNLGITGTRQIGSVTQTVVKLGAATGESMPQLAQGLIQLNRLMGQIDSRQIGNMANALVTTSKDAGVSATGVLAFSQAIAPMARQAGIGEAAVIGISTAFNKAGADGYVAANTFNSIISDISDKVRTGSPEIVRYANFVGMTADQFKKMPSAQQISAVFSGIAKGGPQAFTFVNELGLGTRAQAAVAAVSQSGGIDRYINLAQGSSGNQNNLNRGARAAFNNVIDQGAQLRNELTQLGDTLGAPLLGPIDLLLRGLTDMAHGINTVVHALGPVAPILAGIAGSALGLGGLALGHAGLVGGLATARLFFGRSGPRRAFGEGREVGLAQYGGMAAEDAALINASGARYAGGNLPLRAQLPFIVGRGLGRRGYGAAAAAGATEEAAAVSAGSLAAGWSSKLMLGGPAWFLNQQSKTLRDSRLPDYERSAYAMNGLGTREKLAAYNADVKARLQESGVIRTVTGDLAGLGRAAVTAGVETTRAAGSMSASLLGRVRGKGGLAVGGLGGGMGGLLLGSMLGGDMGAALGGGLGLLGGGLAGRAGMLGGAAGLLGKGASALFSPLGLGAMLLGPSLIHGVSGLFRGNSSQNSETNDFLNPVKQLNDQIGITTTNLATFGQALRDNAPKGNAPPATLSDLRSLSHTTFNQQLGSRPSNATIGALASHGNLTVPNAVALAQSFNMSDPRTVEAFRNDLIRSGMKRQDVESVMQQLIPAGGGTVGTSPNLAVLAGAVRRTETGKNASKTGNLLQQSALTSIGTTFNSNLDTHSAGFAQVKQLQDSLSYLGALGTNFSKGPKSQGAAFYNALATLTGGKSGDFKASYEAGIGNPETPQGILQLLNSTPAGKKFLRNVTTEAGPSILNRSGTIDPTKLAGYLSATAGAVPTGGGTTLSVLQQSGPLGQRLGGSALFNAATTGAQQGQSSAVLSATEETAASAAELAHGFTGAAGNLMKLSDAMGGADTTTGQLIAAAAQWARTLQSFQLPYMSRNAQVGVSVGNLQQSYAAAHAPGASPASVDQYKSDLQNYQQQKQAYYSYLQETYRTAQQYGTQMYRAAQDENDSISRSKRDFYISQQQSQEDYQRQTLRSEADFNRQLQRQAEDASKSIYNPFQRVSAQYTADAGTLVQNLEDQNQRIGQQMQQLQQLRKAGVSQQAIDQLQLADPNNAQQLNNLVGSLAQNPQLIAKINGLVKTRVDATTSLVNSDFNQNFRRTLQDFNIGLSRTSQDYQTAHDRAVSAQNRALGDMAYDYNKMVTRSAADLNTAMTELYGSFGTMFGKTMDMVNKDVAKYAPAAAKTIDDQLSALKAKYPTLFDPNYTGANPVGPVHSGGQRAQHYTAAVGGITVGPSHVFSSEWSPSAVEGHIPVNSYGEQQMVSLITRALAQGFVNAGMNTSGPGSSIESVDASFNVNGPVTVQASDTKTLQRDLEAKAKLRRLASPVRRS